MFRVWLLSLSCLGLFLHSVSFAFATTLWPKVNQPARIISLAPNITEALFAIGAGHRVVGVSDHCDYPTQVTQLPRVGGMRPNLEIIVALKPDLVILSTSQMRISTQLEQLGVQTLSIEANTLEDIRLSLRRIGEATGHAAQAQQIIDTLDHDIAVIKQKTDGLTRPRVIVSFAHHLNAGITNKLYIAGQHDFYHDLLQLAGGQNAYQKPFPKVPVITTEGLFALNPDIIIDVFPETDDQYISINDVREHWQQLTELNAIRHQRLYLLEADYATIPGPRIGILLKQFARIIHPELDWSGLSQR